LKRRESVKLNPLFWANVRAWNVSTGLGPLVCPHLPVLAHGWVLAQVGKGSGPGILHGRSQATERDRPTYGIVEPWKTNTHLQAVMCKIGGLEPIEATFVE